MADLKNSDKAEEDNGDTKNTDTDYSKEEEMISPENVEPCRATKTERQLSYTRKETEEDDASKFLTTSRNSEDIKRMSSVTEEHQNSNEVNGNVNKDGDEEDGGKVKENGCHHNEVNEMRANTTMEESVRMNDSTGREGITEEEEGYIGDIDEPIKESVTIEENLCAKDLVNRKGKTEEDIDENGTRRKGTVELEQGDGSGSEIIKGSVTVEDNANNGKCFSFLYSFL